LTLSAEQDGADGWRDCRAVADGQEILCTLHERR
jgi:hypothetical protein